MKVKIPQEVIVEFDKRVILLNTYIQNTQKQTSWVILEVLEKLISNTKFFNKWKKKNKKFLIKILDFSINGKINISNDLRFLLEYDPDFFHIKEIKIELAKLYKEALVWKRSI